MPAKSYTFLYPLAATQWSHGSLPFKLDCLKIAVDRLNRSWKWVSALEVNIQPGKSLWNLLIPFTREFQLGSGLKPNESRTMTNAPVSPLTRLPCVYQSFALNRYFLFQSQDGGMEDYGGEMSLLASQWEMVDATRTALWLNFSGTVQRLSQALRATSGTRAETRVSALLLTVIQKTRLRRIGLKASGVQTKPRAQIGVRCIVVQMHCRDTNPGMDQKATKHTWRCSWSNLSPWTL